MNEPKYIDADKLLIQAWNNLYKLEDVWEESVGPDFIIHGRPEMQAGFEAAHKAIVDAPAADVVEVVRCKDCKHWRQQTNYQGAPLSFGFCESDDMWQSLYGETYEVEHIDTDDDFYCGYAKRRTDE